MNSFWEQLAKRGIFPDGSRLSEEARDESLMSGKIDPVVESAWINMYRNQDNRDSDRDFEFTNPQPKRQPEPPPQEYDWETTFVNGQRQHRLIRRR